MKTMKIMLKRGRIKLKIDLLSFFNQLIENIST